MAVAVTALVSVNDGAGDWYIAVRSGGHNLAASNNIDNGVTIDLSLLNAATYDKSTNLASVGPGGKWMDVYRTLLDQYNVSVVGGRDGFVFRTYPIFELAWQTCDKCSATCVQYANMNAGTLELAGSPLEAVSRTILRVWASLATM